MDHRTFRLLGNYALVGAIGVLAAMSSSCRDERGSNGAARSSDKVIDIATTMPDFPPFARLLGIHLGLTGAELTDRRSVKSTDYVGYQEEVEGWQVSYVTRSAQRGMSVNPHEAIVAVTALAEFGNDSAATVGWRAALRQAGVARSSTAKCREGGTWAVVEWEERGVPVSVSFSPVTSTFDATVSIALGAVLSVTNIDHAVGDTTTHRALCQLVVDLIGR